MLDDTRGTARRPSCPDSPPAPLQRPGVDGLIGDLEKQRIRAQLQRVGSRVFAGGITLSVPVQTVLCSTTAAETLLSRLLMLTGQGMPTTLSLAQLGTGDAAINALDDFCSLLRRTLAAAGRSTAQLGLCLPSHVMPLQAYLLIATAVLGHGPRFVLLDRLQMQHARDPRAQEYTDNNWAFLRRRSNGVPALLPAYARSVTTRCSLLDDEHAGTVSDAGLQVPAASAWLPMELDLTDFSDGRGRVSWPELQHSLARCVEIGDRLLTRLSWPDAAQRADARLNRRLAVTVQGIGDLLLERAAEPADLKTLQWLDSCLGRVSRTLWTASAMLARSKGPLPAIVQAEPATGWRGTRQESAWQVRWQRAVANCGVRHRNLVVLSPYSVLPSCEHEIRDFIDLLPLMRHADAYRFAAPAARGRCNTQEFAAYHRRAFAVIQQRNAASVVAAGA